MSPDPSHRFHSVTFVQPCGAAGCARACAVLTVGSTIANRYVPERRVS